MRTTDLLLVGLLALSAAGLVVLGISAADAVEARTALQARSLLDGAAGALSTGLERILRDADEAADDWTPDAPPHSLIADVFIADERGHLLHPEVASFPAVPPPDPEEADRVRRYLREARALDRETAADLLRTAAYEEFTHPDLVGVLVLEMADRAKQADVADRAAYLYGSITTDLPGARDLDGEALAPTAHLRRLSVLEDASERRNEASAFAGRLADRAWDLPRVEREMILARLAEEFPEGRLPDAVRSRREFVDAFRARVRFATGEGGWRHEAVRRDGAVHLFGWRELIIDGRTRTFGYRIGPEALRERAKVIAGGVAERYGARLEIDLGRPVTAGALPRGEALAQAVDLPPAFGSVDAAVAVRSPSGLGGLRTLHIAMTIVLAVALGVGVFFSVRAVRRELATARVRQNLLDNTSHELRTPLTTIRMHAEMLAEEELPEEKRGEYLRLVLAESERLSRLVDDVLDLSKLTRGEPDLVMESAPPRELARAAVESWSHGEVATNVSPNLPAVLADRDATVRVLLNLLENARKYAGGATSIEGRAHDGAVELIVADAGPGIPYAERDRLFERFFRSARDARKVKGVGLGLVLAREIARGMGGDLYLVDTSAEGSRFALRLRVAKEES